jgi:dCTP deaminase
MRICQLVFAKMEEPAENPYRGKYQGQRGTTASRIFMDKD